MPRIIPLKTEPGRRICLGIAVDNEDLHPLDRQARGEINSGSGFTHPTLLIDDANYLPHGISD